jgi:hypothetical protein
MFIFCIVCRKTKALKSVIMNTIYTNKLEVFKQSLQEKMLPGETILWADQPEPYHLFNGSDIILIPFSLVWCAFLINAYVNVFSSPTKHFVGIFLLFTSAFVLVGAYMLFGRFIYKVWKKKKTFYVITNKRALICIEGASRSIRQLNLFAANNIIKKVDKNGFGSIILREPEPGLFNRSRAYGDHGMDILPSSNREFAFYDIENVEEVHRTIWQITSRDR